MTLHEKSLQRIFRATHDERLVVRVDQRGWFGLVWADDERWAIPPEPFLEKEFLVSLALTHNHARDLLHEVAISRGIVLDLPQDARS